MKKKMLSCLLVILLTAAPVFAAETGQTGAAAEEPKEAAGLSDVLTEILDYIPEDTDLKTIAEDLEVLNSLFSSEEFKSLMSYPEVRSLAEEVVRKSAAFVLEEKELTRKILVTAGMNEKSADAVVSVLQAADANKDLIAGLIEDVDWEDIIEYTVSLGTDTGEEKPG